MLNELEEFRAYTEFPLYVSAGKRDTSYLGRFTFDMLLGFEGLARVLTILARGYMWETDEPDIDRSDVRSARGAVFRTPKKPLPWRSGNTGRTVPICTVNFRSLWTKTGTVGLFATFKTSGNTF